MNDYFFSRGLSRSVRRKCPRKFTARCISTPSEENCLKKESEFNWN